MKVALSAILLSCTLLTSTLLAQAYPLIEHFARTNWTIGAGTVSLNPRDTSLDFYSGSATISTNGNISGRIRVNRFPSGSSASAGVSRVVANYSIHPGSKISGPFRLDRAITYTNLGTSGRSVYELEMYSADLFLTAGGTPKNPLIVSKTRPDITYVRRTDYVGSRPVSVNQWFEENSIHAAIFGTNGVRGLLIISDPRVYSHD